MSVAARRQAGRAPSSVMRLQLRALVDGLGSRPDDQVLEIGCAQVCELLAGGSGRLTAIDRSPKMIEASERRDAAFVAAGKAEFLGYEPQGSSTSARGASTSCSPSASGSFTTIRSAPGHLSNPGSNPPVVFINAVFDPPWRNAR